jgi:DNA-binding LacI/PurR family transcriptional regulator
LTPCSQIEKGCKVRKIKKNGTKSQGRVTLKALAEYVGLSTGTISIVLNDTPRATVIPQRTKDRILEAARVLNYRSNPFARVLRANWGVTASAGVEDAGGSSGTLMFVGPEHWRRAIQAIRSAGLRVPGDVSIADVDGSPAAFFRSRWEL